MELIFPSSQEGISNRGKFDRFLETGEKVVLKNIGAKFSSVPDWYKRLFGDLLLIKGDLEVGQIISSENVPTIPATISITDKYGHKTPVQPVELKLVSAGNKTLIWSNKHQKSAPLLFTFFISESQVEFSLSLADALVDLFTVRNSLKFVQALSTGGEFRLNSDQSDEFASGTALPNPELQVSVEYCELVDKLCEIQVRTGKIFRMNPSREFNSQADIEAINEIFSIIKTGKLISHKQEWIESVPIEMLVSISEMQSQSEYVNIGSYWKSSCLTLLNQKIELGHGYGFASGKVELSSKEVQELKDALSKEKKVQLKLTDALIIDVFPTWFISEAKRISSLLTEKFQVSSIYLFGSLVWGDHITPETDIDLAISGFEPGKLYKIIGFVELETQFSFDLIDLNGALPALRERILTEGELLYEREAVAVGG
jgi:predicted nucleotidyltransferase